MKAPVVSASLVLLAATSCTSRDDLPTTPLAPPTTAPSATTTPTTGDGGPPCSTTAFAGDPIGVHCGRLVDAQGRVRVFRGVNARVAGVFDVTFDDGRLPLEPIPDFTADDAVQMRDFGFDALRLPINWSGVEPTESGGFDEAYLDRVQATVDAAWSAGVQVLLDLHQDAYSKEIGEDGAPLWAIYPPPTKDQLLGGPLTDLGARRMSLIVGEAFSSFFGAGFPGPDLRKRFVAMAAHVAARFADHPGVLGLELFNEPLANKDGLLALDQAGYAAVRAAMPKKLFVFEPDATRNLLDSAPDGPGSLGPGTAYAPHLYKYAFAASSGASKAGLEPQIANAVDEAKTWGAALLSTEWGFDPKAPNAADYFRWHQELQDQYQVSSFFWLWKEESQGSWGCFDFDGASWTPRASVVAAFARVRPEAIAGWPSGWSFDRASGDFELKFTSDPAIAGPHVIVVPSALGAPTSITCDGANVDGASDGHGFVTISCGERDGKDHVLHVSVAPPS